MSKTTTKTVTVVEKFDAQGNLTERTTTTKEDSTEVDWKQPYEPYVPNAPWRFSPNTRVTFTNACTCGTSKPCYKHCTVINADADNTTTVKVDDLPLTTSTYDAKTDALNQPGPCECDLCTR